MKSKQFDLNLSSVVRLALCIQIKPQTCLLTHCPARWSPCQGQRLALVQHPTLQLCNSNANVDFTMSHFCFRVQQGGSQVLPWALHTVLSLETWIIHTGLFIIQILGTYINMCQRNSAVATKLWYFFLACAPRRPLFSDFLKYTTTQQSTVVY